MASGFTVTAGRFFQVMSFGDVSGNFATMNGVAPAFTATLNPTNLLVTAAATSR